MDVSDKIKEIVAEHLGIEKSLIEGTSEFDDLGADSLDLVEIVMSVEEEFDIEIPDETLEGLATFGQFVEKVQELQE
jgi:acyl carrier protein